MEEANPIEILRARPVISYSCKKEQGGKNEFGLYEGDDGERQEPIDVFWDRNDYFNFNNCTYLIKKENHTAATTMIPHNYIDSERKMTNDQMKKILYSVNPDFNLTEETIKENVKASENYKNDIKLISTKLIKDVYVHHAKFFFHITCFADVRKRYKNLVYLLKKNNEDKKSLTKLEKKQLENWSKIFNYLLTEVWKVGPGKDYEALIEKFSMEHLNIDYGTQPENNRTHPCGRKLVNRRKNIVRKQITDAGKQLKVNYRRQGKFSTIIND